MENGAINRDLYNFYRSLKYEASKLPDDEKQKFDNLITNALRNSEIDETGPNIIAMEATISRLSHWKRETEMVWGPVIEYGQTKFKIQYGGSIAVEVLRRLKEYEILFP